MLLWCRSLILCGVILPLHAQNQPPDFPKAFTGHAEFETTAGFRENGWASLVAARSGSELYILSVRRLLGPEGGFSNQVSAEQVPSFVRHIKIDSFSEGTHSYIVGGLPVPSLHVDPLQSPIDDLTVYRLHNDDLSLKQGVKLAVHPPAIGETVWLMTKAGETAALESATVVSSSKDGWLTVQLKTTLNKDATGAPVLNSAGELVGIYSHRDAKDSALLDLIPTAAVLQAMPQT